MKTHEAQHRLGGLLTTWFVLLMFVLLAGCQNESRGFALPEGDIERGEQLFLDLACTRCHSIGDIEWTGHERYDDPHVVLGGQTTMIKTYGELVTSVINPSHKISQQSITDQRLTLVKGMSKMELPRYNEIMTVQELVDIVTFLQSEYEVVRPENTYPYYGF